MPVVGNALYKLLDLDLGSQDLNRLDYGPESEARQVAASLLLKSILKKHAANVSSNADARALEKFKAVNSRCHDWALDDSRSLVEDTILGEVRENLYRFWFVNSVSDGECASGLCENPYWLLSDARMGPGASVGADGEDFYTKLFSSQLACTDPSLYTMYKHWCSQRTTWREAEELRFRHFGSPALVKQSLMSCVPKDDSISRTICTEPSLNMFFQLGLAEVLSRRLHSWGIDIDSQQRRNRFMAKVGSRFPRSYSTIDLSSASDSISLKMLEYLLPKQWYELLCKLRCPETSIKGESLTLHMVSTMGNGYTFPLQTVLFAAVVRAVYKIMGIKTRDGKLNRSYSVFGDDIIVVTKAYKAVCRTLNLLGFVVNSEKSFEVGFFKESCGVDAWKGKDVRGVYLKELHDAVPYVLFNRLLRWSARNNIRLPLTLSWLFRMGRPLRVPLWEADDAGYHTPLSYCGDLERSSGTGAYIYRKMSVCPISLKVKEGRIHEPRGRKRRIFNDAGLLLSAVGGYVRSDKILLRPQRGEKVIYRQRTAQAPNWHGCATVKDDFSRFILTDGEQKGDRLDQLGLRVVQSRVIRVSDLERLTSALEVIYE